MALCCLPCPLCVSWKSSHHLASLSLSLPPSPSPTTFPLLPLPLLSFYFLLFFLCWMSVLCILGLNLSVSLTSQCCWLQTQPEATSVKSHTALPHRHGSASVCNTHTHTQ